MTPIELIKNVLIAIGENPEREGLLDTPERVVKSWQQLYAGYTQDPKCILSTVFEDGACDDIVILKNIEFSSTCEHHMLPFMGQAHIAYLPHGKIVGISKLARLVDCFAKRLQLQENMTQQIAHAIMDYLSPRGVAVILTAHHQCMSCRGVRQKNTTVITRSTLGMFRDNPGMRTELMMLLSQEI